MDLEDKSQLAKTAKIGRQVVEILAGQTLKIETSPDGEEILTTIVPAGKKWTVYVYVEITETELDA